MMQFSLKETGKFMTEKVDKHSNYSNYYTIMALIWVYVIHNFRFTYVTLELTNTTH